MESMVSSWQDKNVLVTGAAGFLGSWIVSSLIEKQANPVCLVLDKNHRSIFFSQELNKSYSYRWEFN